MFCKPHTWQVPTLIENSQKALENTYSKDYKHVLGTLFSIKVFNLLFENIQFQTTDVSLLDT